MMIEKFTNGSWGQASLIRKNDNIYDKVYIKE